MPFNALLLPLLGGFVFVSKWNATRFDTRRYSGERLLLHSALAGVAFLTLAFLVTRMAMILNPGLHSWWRGLVPFEYTGTSLLAFGLGASVWYPMNHFWNRESEAIKAIEQWGGFLEMLFARSVNETRQVSLSLTSGKVYIGFVTSSFDPAFDREYMKLMPTLSGYRDGATREMVITRDYASVYETLIDDTTGVPDLADDFQLIIPVAEITSANLFDPAVYELFAEAEAAFDS